MGPPTHWITFTAKPSWPDLKECVRTMEAALGRTFDNWKPEEFAHLIGRIYRKKRKQFLALLRKGNGLQSPLSPDTDPGCGKALYLQLVDEFQNVIGRIFICCVVCSMWDHGSQLKLTPI